MSEQVNKRNIDTLVDAVNKMRKAIELQKTELAKANNNIVILQAELQNTKQLVAHVMGKGMGPTS